MNEPTGPLDTPSLGALLAELGAEARAHRFEVAPNPCVGAAVLAGSEVVARGYHRYWGGPHAEVEALEKAASSGFPRESWDTLVVTLEPCSSRGKTPPCTEAILKSGIKSLVVASADPDFRHRGIGLRALDEAGVDILQIEQAAPLETVSPHFLHWLELERVRRPRPWVVSKWAQTLTGQLTPPASVGGGRWITGEVARAEVCQLRSRVDAILTGVGTVLADDPALTVRPAELCDRAPARVILDTALRTPPEARLFRTESGEAGGPVHILSMAGADAGGSRANALAQAGAELHGLRGDDVHHLNLREVSRWLWAQGFERVLLEAGPCLQSSFLDAGFVDQVRVYTGPIPGGRGESLGTWLSPARLEERHDRDVGEDQVLEAFLAPR